MHTLTIYHGAAKPVNVRGQHVCRLVAFAERNPGWHTVKLNRTTKRALAAALRLGCVEVSGDQFRFVYPK